MAKVIPIQAEHEEVRLLCAGQGCPKREHCLRYRIRRTTAQWASYDIERELEELKNEPCPGYYDNWMRRNTLAGGRPARVGPRR